MVTLEFLKAHSLFGGIRDRELKKVRFLMREENFSKGEFIIHEGDVGDRLFFIVKGSVEILKEVSTAKGEKLERIAVLGDGDMFGEMELIDIQPRAANVKALEDTTALTLSNRDLHQIEKWNLKTFTIILMNLAREISRRLRRMDALMASALFASKTNTKKS